MDVEPQSAATAQLFDAMAEEYDVLEPWYEHFYACVHAILTAQLVPPPDGRRRRALDAGCGTGFQTTLLHDLGYDTYGVDLSTRLLAHARRREPAARFARADVTALPYRDAAFDAVSCVGGTLSFVEAPDAALAEIARVLRPGGLLVLECEHKWSLDLGWSLLSALTGDALGYGVTARQLWRAFRRPLRAPIVLPYPGYGALTLFSATDLRLRLGAVGLSWRRAWGLHAITNLIPSTVLHRARLPRGLATIYRALRALDASAAPTAFGRALANSVVVLSSKT
jgi:ubiquinone/menaquinone biosynthesis C-methylase UbiE